MRLIKDIIAHTPTLNKLLTKQLNEENRAMDNDWLFGKIAEGWLTQQALTEIQIIKDACEQVYPDLWDLQLEVWDKVVDIVKVTEQEVTTANLCKHQLDYSWDGDDRRYYFTEDFDWREGFNEETDSYEAITLGRPSVSNGDYVTIRLGKTIRFRIIVKFPFVTITNGNINHDIRDIYFRFSYGGSDIFPVGSFGEYYRESTGINKIILNGIECELLKYRFMPYVCSARSTITLKEWDMGYLHSHSMNCNQSYSEYMHFRNCCLGGGEINNVLSMLCDSVSVGMVSLLLHQLAGYAAWESLDGGPYLKIEQLNRVASYYVTHPQLSNYQKQDYFLAWKRAVRSVSGAKITDLDWSIKNKSVLKIVDNQKLQDTCKRFNSIAEYQNIYGQNASNLILLKGDRGTFYSVNARVGTDIPDFPETTKTQYYILFKQEKVGLTILPDIEDGVVIEQGFIVNKNLTDYIKNKIEGYANFKKTRDNSIRRASQSSY